jgi:hypothetical protein
MAKTLFKVIITLEDSEIEASDLDIERSAVTDNATDFLSDEELRYYFSLDEL